jgi:hypothetical protein
VNCDPKAELRPRNKQGFASAFARKPLILDGAEAGIEPFSLSLKIKENFKFENFSISMCTLIGLFQWYDRPSLSYPKLTVATGRDRPKATIR